ncbi:MAG: SDR family oxidoreductase [Chloroflexi bacterium]|nr:SDR family oxidoreductase [Chloroflexota bacterium]
MKIALVTGANRGIGQQICADLAAKNIQVVLTSRDLQKGEAAAQIIRASQPQVQIVVQQLDVTSDESVNALHDFVLKTYGRLDILVNNGAILIDDDVSIFNLDIPRLQATLEANLYGPLRLCQAFIPLMQTNGYGRVVNVSSEMGQLSDMGVGTAAYRISKTALNSLTTIFAAEVGRGNIKINCCTPGWVRTDMGGPSAHKSVAEGADTPVWLATLPDDAPTGQFFADREIIAW